MKFKVVAKFCYILLNVSCFCQIYNPGPFKGFNAHFGPGIKSYGSKLEMKHSLKYVHSRSASLKLDSTRNLPPLKYSFIKSR